MSTITPQKPATASRAAILADLAAHAAHAKDLRRAGGESVVALLELTYRCHDTSGGRAAARLLAGLWNGYDYPFDVSELRVLDGEHLDHAMRVLRAYAEINANPASLVKDGDHHIAEMIKRCAMPAKGGN